MRLLRKRFARGSSSASVLGSPPIFADLLLELPGCQERLIDVEEEGWLKWARPLLEQAVGAGLVLRGEKRPRVFIGVTGQQPPEYFSRVVGQFSPQGHFQTRVACLRCGGELAVLHQDGRVERIEGQA